MTMSVVTIDTNLAGYNLEGINKNPHHANNNNTATDICTASFNITTSPQLCLLPLFLYQLLQLFQVTLHLFLVLIKFANKIIDKKT